MLGLLNNFLYVAMNAGAQNINEAGMGWVYFANILPCLGARKRTLHLRVSLFGWISTSLRGVEDTN